MVEDDVGIRDLGDHQTRDLLGMEHHTQSKNGDICHLELVFAFGDKFPVKHAAAPPHDLLPFAGILLLQVRMESRHKAFRPRRRLLKTIDVGWSQGGSVALCLGTMRLVLRIIVRCAGTLTIVQDRALHIVFGG